MATPTSSTKVTQLLAQALEEGDKGCYNFVEIRNIPKKVNAKTLASMIATISKMIPEQTDICMKDHLDSLERVALVKFKSEYEAFKAIEKLKQMPYARQWHMNIIKDPSQSDPEVDMLKKWLR